MDDVFYVWFIWRFRYERLKHPQIANSFLGCLSGSSFSAIQWTWSGIKLLTSPKFENSLRNSVPLKNKYKGNYNHYCEYQWWFEWTKYKVISIAYQCLTAVYVGSAHAPVIEEIQDGKFQVLFFSPECLLTELDWRDALHSKVFQEQLAGFIVDEVAGSWKHQMFRRNV